MAILNKDNVRNRPLWLSLGRWWQYPDWWYSSLECEYAQHSHQSHTHINTVIHSTHRQVRQHIHTQHSLTRTLPLLQACAHKIWLVDRTNDSSVHTHTHTRSLYRPFHPFRHTFPFTHSRKYTMRIGIERFTFDAWEMCTTLNVAFERKVIWFIFIFVVLVVVVVVVLAIVVVVILYGRMCEFVVWMLRTYWRASLSLSLPPFLSLSVSNSKPNAVTIRDGIVVRVAVRTTDVSCLE